MEKEKINKSEYSYIPEAVCSFCGMFVFGGCVNLGETGLFFATPFLLISAVFYFISFLNYLKNKNKLFFRGLLLFYIFCFLLYYLRINNIQNAFYYPANGRTFVMASDYCLIEDRSLINENYNLVHAINYHNECPFTSTSNPKGILLKKGEEFKVIRTDVSGAGIAKEGYSILFQTKVGIGYFYGDSDEIYWKDSGKPVKHSDMYNDLVMIGGRLMNYPQIFFKRI